LIALGCLHLSKVEERMAKNVLIFSDGTGQAGGLRPDQRLSNIYKLFRATRIDPQNMIDPGEQIAFYDAGLGSNDIGDPLWVRPFSYLRKLFASATGSGISRNVTDCYEAILEHYEPGDRVYLFGFSRGGYTVRCLANVLRLCGVPTQGENGASFPKRGPALRKIAEEAVYKVYDHSAGIKRENKRVYLEREQLGLLFRKTYASTHPNDQNLSNAAAYFIGVFDSVAALGMRPWMRYGAIICAGSGLLALSWLASFPFGYITDWSTAQSTATIFGISIVAIVIKLFRTLYKHVPGAFLSGHFAVWRGDRAQTDTQLDPAVTFARHALAIDERRYDFVRALWGSKSTDTVGNVKGVPRMKQIWFAGNHSDIGGSYPENESRLSDFPLAWMVEETQTLPHKVHVDETKLHIYPQADGMQHCEVEATRETLYPRWWPKELRWSWKTDIRTSASGATHHPSVEERFKLPAVTQMGELLPYRPLALIYDPRYGEDCQKANAGALPAGCAAIWSNVLRNQTG
jgi:uncharacterized protein (DUF2235 family)